MKHETASRRGALLAATVLSAGLLAIAPASAHPGNGHGGGNPHADGMMGGESDSHMSAQGRANSNGWNADERFFGSDRADLRHTTNAARHHRSHLQHANHVPNGGQSASHISDQGLANTNGPNAAVRLHGTARAEARHSLHGSNLIDASSTTKVTPNGGQSSSHISDEGKANTNGPNADTRLFGSDRAAARHDRTKPHPK